MVDPDLTLCDYFAVVGFDKNHGLNVRCKSFVYFDKDE